MSLYTYLESIIDNHLPLGELEYIEEKIFSSNRGIYCVKEEYKSTEEQLIQINSTIDLKNIQSIDVMFEDFYILVPKKEQIVHKEKTINCISFNIIKMNSASTYKGRWSQSSEIYYTLLVYENTDVTYELSRKMKVVPCNFKILKNSHNYKVKEKLYLTILEYYKNTYEYLFKDYYDEFKELASSDKECKLSIRQELLFKVKTKNEYFNSALKACKGIKGYNFNKHSFKTGYAVAKIFNSLDEKSQKWIISQKEVEYENPMGNGVAQIHIICSDILVNNMNSKKNSDLSYMASDYARLCKQNRHKICIVPMGKNKLYELHDKEMEAAEKREIKKKKISKACIIPKDSKFEYLYDHMPKVYKPLVSELELYKESQVQHNCVYYNYTNDVKNDECAIFHVTLSNNEYTIEINKTKGGTYKLKQMQKTYNNGYDETDKEYVKNTINEINTTMLNEILIEKRP